MPFTNFCRMFLTCFILLTCARKCRVQDGLSIPDREFGNMSCIDIFPEFGNMSCIAILMSSWKPSLLFGCKLNGLCNNHESCICVTFVSSTCCEFDVVLSGARTCWALLLHSISCLDDVGVPGGRKGNPPPQHPPVKFEATTIR